MLTPCPHLSPGLEQRPGEDAALGAAAAKHCGYEFFLCRPAVITQSSTGRLAQALRPAAAGRERGHREGQRQIKAVVYYRLYKFPGYLSWLLAGLLAPKGRSSPQMDRSPDPPILRPSIKSAPCASCPAGYTLPHCANCRAQGFTIQITLPKTRNRTVHWRIVLNFSRPVMLRGPR